MTDRPSTPDEKTRQPHSTRPSRSPPSAGPPSAAGTLPPWFLRAVGAGSALIALAILLATGSFTIVLLFVITAVIALPTAYIWSRIAEGRRQAMDRLVTLGHRRPASASRSPPLFSLLYEVVKRGPRGFDRLVLHGVRPRRDRARWRRASTRSSARW